MLQWPHQCLAAVTAVLAAGRFVPLSVDEDIHLHTSGFSEGSRSPKRPTLLNRSRAFQVTGPFLDAL